MQVRSKAIFRLTIFRLTVFSLCVSLAACVTSPQKVRTTAPNSTAEIYDPLQGFNRGMTKINDKADRYLIKPVASAYEFILPKFLRTGLNNISKNLSEPLIFANEVLQLDPEDASNSLGRFMLNSTFGLGGFFDLAEKEGLPYQRETFDQTLATYGVPAGPYIVLPLLGPTNARGIVGRVGERVAHPVQLSNFDGDGAVLAGQAVVKGLDTRIKAQPFLDNVNQSADPYINLRGLYTQNQLSNIHEDSDPFDNPANSDVVRDDGFADFE